ncbi:uncharacterized protein LOC110230939 isoform X2 [Arabidopsis lyrata subsp. lyrata]|uniref:uncharacterized protein LOC110230939 isoform X2 n=1 Tax=Arabidopsis lyrata subsp. lyrata TaxID=81972 RepID=UPI000A29B607|nr:uncharacterized protein LOC110230939 isoform X2 [Arabidopsis lyrata subsp. lyrata]|eukprot:XP_020890950.1 uncharacterized protein LOC110230939 isoform X2 [Arabidopsis lyrata subsp. lyrata]
MNFEHLHHSTRIIEGNNIDFEPAIDDLYVESAQSMDEDVPVEEAVEEKDDEMDEDSKEEYDTRMYHFGEQVAPARESKSLSEAHKNASLLKKWNKKQDKIIAKSLKTIKSLKVMISCSSSSTAMPQGQPPQDMPSRRYDEPKPRQYGPEPSEHGVSHVPARHSSHEPREHKRRKRAEFARSSSKARLLHVRSSLDRGAGRNRGEEVKYHEGDGAETQQGDSSMAWQESQAGIDDHLRSFFD